MTSKLLSLPRGVALSVVITVPMSSIAAAADDGGARSRRDTHTPAQIAEAQKRVAEWRNR